MDGWMENKPEMRKHKSKGLCLVTVGLYLFYSWLERVVTGVCKRVRLGSAYQWIFYICMYSTILISRKGRGEKGIRRNMLMEEE